MAKRFRLFIFFLYPCTLVLLHPFLWAVESEVGADYWRMSFADPGWRYRVSMVEKIENRSNMVEYWRSERFGYHDNTFIFGYAGVERNWGWEVKAGWTPDAVIMPRQRGEATLALPKPKIPVQPIVAVVYRRFPQALVVNEEAGLAWRSEINVEASARWGKTEAKFTDGNQDRDAATSSYRLAYQFSEQIQIHVLQSQSKDFFDPGNPNNPPEYTIKERGGGFWWMVGMGVRFGGAYTVERRSDETLIKKYSVSVQQVY